MKPDNTQETIYVGLDTGLPPYLPYPRFLLKMDISQTAKLLYALLLDRTTLSQRNGWQDDQGRTFIVYPIAEIAEMLDKGQTAIKAALNELDAAGLLERKRAGSSMMFFLSTTIYFVPASYLADISKSSAESTSVIIMLSLDTATAIPLPQSIFSNFMPVPPSMNCRQNPALSSLVTLFVL